MFSLKLVIAFNFHLLSFLVITRFSQTLWWIPNPLSKNSNSLRNLSVMHFPFEVWGVFLVLWGLEEFFGKKLSPSCSLRLPNRWHTRKSFPHHSKNSFTLPELDPPSPDFYFLFWRFLLLVGANRPVVILDINVLRLQHLPSTYTFD